MTRPVSPRSPRRRLEPQFGDRIRPGVLTEEIPPKWSTRYWSWPEGPSAAAGFCWPAAMVCFVLALCLFSSSDSAGPPGYRVVLRTLTEKLRHLPGGIVQRLPTSPA
ncbi:hypothetical protein [Streptomyces sp. NPDC060002]|uniref:hypothetical protein n=1 Tax=Streptomyces sp. NPDC060002 TaxID=3347033 RepID=UPI00368B73D1